MKSMISDEKKTMIKKRNPMDDSFFKECYNIIAQFDLPGEMLLRYKWPAQNSGSSIEKAADVFRLFLPRDQGSDVDDN